jgi:hypothetical protein
MTSLARKPSISSLFGSSSSHLGNNNKADHGQNHLGFQVCTITSYQNSNREGVTVSEASSCVSESNSPAKKATKLELPHCIDQILHYKFNNSPHHHSSNAKGNNANGNNKTPPAALSSFLLDWLQQVDTLDKDILNDEVNRTILNQNLKIISADSLDEDSSAAKSQNNVTGTIKKIGSLFKKKGAGGSSVAGDGASQLSTWSKASAIKKAWMKSIRGSSSKKDFDPRASSGIKGSESVSSSLYLMNASTLTKRLAKCFIRIPKIQVIKGASSILVDGK